MTFVILFRYSFRLYSFQNKSNKKNLENLLLVTKVQRIATHPSFFFFFYLLLYYYYYFFALSEMRIMRIENIDHEFIDLLFDIRQIDCPSIIFSSSHIFFASLIQINCKFCDKKTQKQYTYNIYKSSARDCRLNMVDTWRLTVCRLY